MFCYIQLTTVEICYIITTLTKQSNSDKSHKEVNNSQTGGQLYIG